MLSDPEGQASDGFPREGITSAVMAELLGLADRHGEGRRGESRELQFNIGWEVGNMGSIV